GAPRGERVPAVRALRLCALLGGIRRSHLVPHLHCLRGRPCARGQPGHLAQSLRFHRAHPAPGLAAGVSVYSGRRARQPGALGGPMGPSVEPGAAQPVAVRRGDPDFAGGDGGLGGAHRLPGLWPLHGAPMTPEAPAERYRKLPGHRRGILRGASLWLGSDHVLSVKSLRFREEYKRFHFRDVQAIVIVESPRFHISTRALLIGWLWTVAFAATREVTPWMPAVVGSAGVCLALAWI